MPKDKDRVRIASRRAGKSVPWLAEMLRDAVARGVISQVTADSLYETYAKPVWSIPVD